MAVYGLCLVLLVMVVGSVQGKGDGVFFKDVMVNHGIVTREDIGTLASNAIQCRTTVADCCTDSDTNTGQWFFPHSETVLPSTNIYQEKGPQYVYLHRRAMATGIGILRCEIGVTGSEETYYVGVYPSGSGIGAVTISGQIDFSLLTDVNATTDPVFTLTCTSTGGPATEAIWTLDGSPASGTESQNVTDTVNAIYSNTLTVTGRHTGNYQCSVTNDRNTSPATQTLSVTGPPAPTIINSVVDSTSIQLSWSAVTSTMAMVLKYQVSYQQTSGADQMGCDFDGAETNRTSGIIDVDFSVTDYTLTGLEEFSTYDVTVTAVDVFGPSEPSEPLSVTTDPSAPSASPDGVEADAQNDGSIIVTWGEVPCLEQNSEITQYIVQYSCNVCIGIVSVTINAPTHLLTLTGLSSGTQYSIRVAAVNSAGEMGPFSDAVTAKPPTSSTVPETTPSVSTTAAVVGTVMAGVLLTVIGLSATIIIWLVWRLCHYTSVSPQKDQRAGAIPLGERVAYGPHSHHTSFSPQKDQCAGAIPLGECVAYGPHSHHTSFSPQKDQRAGAIPLGECVAYGPHSHGQQQTGDYVYETAISQEPPVSIGGGGGGGKGGQACSELEYTYEVGVSPESPRYLEMAQEKMNIPPAGRREEEVSTTIAEEPTYEPFS